MNGVRPVTDEWPDRPVQPQRRARVRENSGRGVRAVREPARGARAPCAPSAMRAGRKPGSLGHRGLASRHCSPMWIAD